MKFYGYVENDVSLKDITPSLLAEVTLCASPNELRLMADFLNACAAEMEQMGASYDHVHLSDRMSLFEDSPHFVVCRGK
jgi:hypothetical protein